MSKKSLPMQIEIVFMIGVVLISISLFSMIGTNSDRIDNIEDVLYKSNIECIYMIGNNSEEGSIRACNNIYKNIVRIQEFVNGTWERAELKDSVFQYVKRIEANISEIEIIDGKSYETIEGEYIHIHEITYYYNEHNDIASIVTGSIAKYKSDSRTNVLRDVYTEDEFREIIIDAFDIRDFLDGKEVYTEKLDAVHAVSETEDKNG